VKPNCILTLTALILAPLTTVHAAERVEEWPKWQQSRVALNRRFVLEEFRIHYTLTGADALPAADQSDTDHDGVPDKIQNIARQLVTARRCYVELLGLRHPFDSPRYHERVKAIDVNVMSLGNKNGSAGDAIVNYHRSSDPPEGVEVVTIDLSAKLPPRNLSPAHELFHVFQNGYSQFKNAWYYEGMARWSEDLLREGEGAAGSLPASRTELEALFQLSYDASRFWQALACAIDTTGRVRVPPELREVLYVGSPKPIIEDDVFHGAKLLKALLEELDRADDVVSKESGLNPSDWSEARQRSPENHRHIWNAVITVSQRSASDSPPLQRMVAAFRRATD
jgi:hypothetical protein